MGGDYCAMCGGLSYEPICCEPCHDSGKWVAGCRRCVTKHQESCATFKLTTQIEQGAEAFLDGELEAPTEPN
jgi:hypothetical protein